MTNGDMNPTGHRAALRLGTRGSRLALAQAELVAEALRARAWPPS
jgi:porphobilinogen deaminase